MLFCVELAPVAGGAVIAAAAAWVVVAGIAVVAAGVAVVLVSGASLGVEVDIFVVARKIP